MDNTTDILFSNITAVTMYDEIPVIPAAYVLVRDGKIAYVGQRRPVVSASREIDGRGKVLMPGLINAHTHLPMTAMRGYADDVELHTWLNDHIFPVEDRLTSRAVRCATELAIAEALSFGTTSVSDMYFFCEDIASAVKASGIKANISRSITFFEGEFDFEAHEGCTEAVSLHEKWHMFDSGRIKIDMSIHAEYTSSYELWEAVAKYAKENELIIQLHLSETESEHSSCVEKYGLTPAEIFNCHNVFDVPVVAAHCVWAEDGDIALLAKKGATAVHNPVSNMKLASGIAPVPKMLESGVNVALGTDGTASNNNLDLFEEIKLAAIAHKAITKNPKLVSAYEALKMATVNGAKAQGREHECGRIAEGFDADLIMLDFSAPHLIPCHNVISNLVYSARGSDVCMTMVRGNILYEDGQFTTIDLNKTLTEFKDHVIPTLFG